MEKKGSVDVKELANAIKESLGGTIPEGAEVSIMQYPFPLQFHVDVHLHGAGHLSGELLRIDRAKRVFRICDQTFFSGNSRLELLKSAMGKIGVMQASSLI